jgi:septal ring factor EnvC (AmiA/AmiB activator)
MAEPAGIVTVMKTLKEIIARAITAEVDAGKANIAEMEAAAAVLVARRDALQSELKTVTAQIEQAATDTKAAQGMIDELTAEVATVQARK